MVYESSDEWVLVDRFLINEHPIRRYQHVVTGKCKMIPEARERYIKTYGRLREGDTLYPRDGDTLNTNPDNYVVVRG